MEKTKLEAVNDALTATNGMIEAGQSLYKLCAEQLGEDYGVYQVLALLRLTKEDLEILRQLLT